MYLLVLALLLKRILVVQACGKDTGATCFVFGCDPKGNATCEDTIVNGKQCRCPDGYCTEPDPRFPSEGSDKLCSYKAECSAHSKCSSLSGHCCPQPNGVKLDCCATESFSIVPDEQDDLVCGRETGATCHIFGCNPDGNATCESGQCVCPDGHCAAPDPLHPEGSDMICAYRAECSAHAGCKGLPGLCCPPPQGTNLDCCALESEHTDGSWGIAISLWILPLSVIGGLLHSEVGPVLF